MIDELWNNPNGTVFNWAEIGFLSRWFDDNDTVRIPQLVSLVQSGRISWAGAGWVQNDEACVHYRSAINQMTEGHLFLQDHFGPSALPKHGWQIDPFGHSAVTPIMFAQMGMSYTVTDRVAKGLTLERIAQHVMEFVWMPPFPWSRVANETSIFGHQLGLTLYNFLGFTFETSDGGPGVPHVTPHNVGYYKDLFSLQVDAKRVSYATDNLLITWGGDFVFYNGSWEWENMGLVMQQEPSAHYATILSYFEKLHSLNRTWPVYTGDFFPYISDPDTVWSGYFSSRAALKGAIRNLDSAIETADAFFVLARRHAGSAFESGPYFKQLQQARRYSGILQHHDAVTGTARDFVVLDYFQMVSNGTTALRSALAASVSALLPNNVPVSATQLPQAAGIVVATTVDARRVRVAPSSFTFPTNPSLAASCQSLMSGELLVEANFSSFSVTAVPLQLCSPLSTTLQRAGVPFNVTRGRYTLNFGANQMLQSVFDSVSGRKMRLQHSLWRYWSIDGSAYLFRADPAGVRTVWGTLSTTITSGLLATEVRQTLFGLGNNITFTWRLYASGGQFDSNNATFLEVEYDFNLVEAGFDYVVRYDTNVDNGNQFFTDDNGWIDVERRYDSEKHVEYSYYPSVECASINDTDTRFAVISSQSQGVTSRLPGSLEVMMFRRLLNSGFPPLGMGQALNDTTPSRHTHLLAFAPSNSWDEIARARVFMANVPQALHIEPSFTFPSTALPSYRSSIIPIWPLHILSFKARDAISPLVMMRVQNLSHQKDISLNISSLFHLQAATEYSMSFNQNWNAVQSSRRMFNGMSAPLSKNINSTNVLVEAGMIRSFLVE